MPLLMWHWFSSIEVAHVHSKGSRPGSFRLALWLAHLNLFLAKCWPLDLLLMLGSLMPSIHEPTTSRNTFNQSAPNSIANTLTSWTMSLAVTSWNTHASVTVQDALQTQEHGSYPSQHENHLFTDQLESLWGLMMPSILCQPSQTTLRLPIEHIETYWKQSLAHFFALFHYCRSSSWSSVRVVPNKARIRSFESNQTRKLNFGEWWSYPFLLTQLEPIM